MHSVFVFGQWLCVEGGATSDSMIGVVNVVDVAVEADSSCATRHLGEVKIVRLQVLGLFGVAWNAEKVYLRDAPLRKWVAGLLRSSQANKEQSAYRARSGAH